MAEERLPPEASVALLDLLTKRFISKADLGRQLHVLHEKRGGVRQQESTETTLKRAFAEAPRKGLSQRIAVELLELAGFEGVEGRQRFISHLLGAPLAEMEARLHAAFAEQEAEAYRVRDSLSGYGLRRVVGSVIEVRRFHDRGGPYWNWGIPVENVALEDTGYPQNYARELRWPDLPVRGENWPKWVLHKILPPDVEDAQDGTATLQLARTDYHTVVQCDPSIYAGYGGHEFAWRERKITDEERLRNRLAYGHLAPERSRVPYCLTLFYVLLLADKKVLYMRRNEDLRWFPGTIEFSGGEQLRGEDLTAANPMQAWVKRAIREEYLVGAVQDAAFKEQLADRLYGKAYLSAVGFDVTTCSFPLFVLVESRCTEDEFRALLVEAHLQPGSRAPDNEGALCIMPLQQVGELFALERTRGRVLRQTASGLWFVMEERPESVADVRLKTKTMHPMTPYRLQLMSEIKH